MKKRILVTGSNGLIGSEVCIYFAQQGHVIHGMDNNQRATFFGPQGDTRWNQQRLAGTIPDFHHHELDIRDRRAVLGALRHIRPDLVVHTAAQPSHDRAAAIPFDDFDTNAVGTLNLLEASRQNCPESPFVHMSTNKVYGDRPNTIPLTESDTRMDFADPAFAQGIAEDFSIDQSLHSLFGASKVASDVMVQEYGRYFGMPTCCLRGGCLTGPSHSGVELHGFLSYLVKCNVEEREYRIYGYKGKQVRDNIHSEDVARFIFEFSKSPRCGEVYNLGGGKENSCSLLEAFSMVEGVTGKRQIHTYIDENRRGDHICYYSDLRKMKSHYPAWAVAKSLPQIIGEIVAAWGATGEARLKMKVLITGACGFVGSVIARELAAQISGVGIIGIDNLSRPGSELNRQSLRQEGFDIRHGDVRNASDLESLPKVDWIIDAAANPSVLAGVSGSTTSRQLIEHNLIGTINLLELSKKLQCGFMMISTSRVYSQSALAELPLLRTGDAFAPDMNRISGLAVTAAGVGETFSTSAPLSLYGASKLASEVMALEYGAAFQLPVYVNRCGLLAGAGQFGKPDQGIVSFWIHAHRARKPLKYIGFEGSGAQTRDCLHPRDLAALLFRQMLSGGKHAGGIVNVSGGMTHSFSLAQLSGWCASRFGAHQIGRDLCNRPFDIPWLVLDSTRAGQLWDWRPDTSLDQIFNEIAEHAASHPGWLEVSRDS